MVSYRIFIVSFKSKTISDFAEAINSSGAFSICGMTENGNEAVLKIKETMPDFVVLSDVIAGPDAFYIIREIKQSCVFVPNFIMLSFSRDENLVKYAASIGVSSVFILPFDYKYVLDRMLGLEQYSMHNEMYINRKSDSDSFEYGISARLLKLGIPINMRGYRYIKTSIELCMKDKNIYENGITKFLYPLVAKMHNTTAESVERSIRCAIKSAWENAGERNNSDIAELSYFSGRPTNSQFIALMLQEAQSNMHMIM